MNVAGHNVEAPLTSARVPPVLVTGATGRVGRAVVAQLLDAGVPVRALTRRPDAAGLRPFCSRRCADVDLGRWLKGSYAIPAVETDDETEGETGVGDAEEGEGGAGPVRH